MKTDFRDVEIGGIFFSGELSVESEDDVEVSNVYVVRPQGSAIRKEEINVNDWEYKGHDLSECLIEELEDKIAEMLESDEEEEDE